MVPSCTEVEKKTADSFFLVDAIGTEAHDAPDHTVDDSIDHPRRVAGAGRYIEMPIRWFFVQCCYGTAGNNGEC